MPRSPSPRKGDNLANWPWQNGMYLRIIRNSRQNCKAREPWTRDRAIVDVLCRFAPSPGAQAGASTDIHRSWAFSPPASSGSQMYPGRKRSPRSELPQVNWKRFKYETCHCSDKGNKDGTSTCLFLAQSFHRKSFQNGAKICSAQGPVPHIRLKSASEV